MSLSMGGIPSQCSPFAPLLAANAGKAKTHQGATGVEPVTSRSAVECSATELYPHTLERAVALKGPYIDC